MLEHHAITRLLAPRSHTPGPHGTRSTVTDLAVTPAVTLTATPLAVTLTITLAVTLTVTNLEDPLRLPHAQLVVLERHTEAIVDERLHHPLRPLLLQPLRLSLALLLRA